MVEHHLSKFPELLQFSSYYFFNSSLVTASYLRTVPTIVATHIFCACQGSRATRKKCATRGTRGLVLYPVSLEGSSYFLWKRCVVF